jgi:hypothetical protein
MQRVPWMCCLFVLPVCAAYFAGRFSSACCVKPGVDPGIRFSIKRPALIRRRALPFPFSPAARMMDRRHPLVHFMQRRQEPGPVFRHHAHLPVQTR